MVIDDVLLRVGSSNLNNRSMGYDTECDLAVEAGEGDETLCKVIHAVRDDLVRKHLGITADELAARPQARSGSLLAAINDLRRDAGRSLRAFDPERIARPRHGVRSLLSRLRRQR